MNARLRERRLVLEALQSVTKYTNELTETAMLVHAARLRNSRKRVDLQAKLDAMADLQDETSAPGGQSYFITSDGYTPKFPVSHAELSDDDISTAVDAMVKRSPEGTTAATIDWEVLAAALRASPSEIRSRYVESITPSPTAGPHDRTVVARRAAYPDESWSDTARWVSETSGVSSTPLHTAARYMAARPWTAAEDATLVAGARGMLTGHPPPPLPGRTPAAGVHRMSSLQLATDGRPRYEGVDLDCRLLLMRRVLPPTAVNVAASILLGRTPTWAAGRATKQLGVSTGGGRWSPEDIAHLTRMVESAAGRPDWTAVGRALGRPSHTCRDQWRRRRQRGQ